MKLSKTILQKILSDSQFSLELSLVLGIKQQSVELNARRMLKGKNGFRLVTYMAVQFYKDKGYSEEDIFNENTGK